MGFKCPVKITNCGVTRHDRIAQLPLLPFDLGLEFSVLRLQLPQLTDVGAIGGANQVRQHVDFGEEPLTRTEFVAGWVSAAQ